MDAVTIKLISKLGFNADEICRIKELSDEYNGNILYKEVKETFETGEKSYTEAIESINSLYENPRGTYLIFILENCHIAYKKYKQKGIDDAIVFDTLSDVRTKLHECLRVTGDFGISRPGFFSYLFDASIFKLGRFQYAFTKFTPLEYQSSGIVLKKNDPVIAVHIPESSEPMDDDARSKSYAFAYRFFGKYYPEYFINSLLPVVCSTWLFFQKHRDFLSEKSSIVRFMNEFDIIEEYEHNSVSVPWWIFGCEAKENINDYPQDTRLRKAYVDWMLAGNKLGAGYGVRLIREG